MSSRHPAKCKRTATLADKAGVGRVWIIHLEKAMPTVEIGLVLGTLKALGSPPEY